MTTTMLMTSTTAMQTNPKPCPNLQTLECLLRHPPSLHCVPQKSPRGQGHIHTRKRRQHQSSRRTLSRDMASVEANQINTRKNGLKINCEKEA
mmetsp:Transcript_20659/g.32740  ORF Transcript_20659/g.32740 Transcript_20659/m.32740 type:complete len:93 (+) Transcript_20659:2914-3192(+)